MAEIELTLNSPITEEQWDAITDVDFDKTDRIWFQTKHGKTVEFVKAEPPTIKAAPPATNANRIRAMSDEELANELGFVAQDAFMYGCGERERMMLYPFENYRSALDWLQSPADGGDGNE